MINWKRLYESSLAFGIRTSLSDTHERKIIENESKNLSKEILELEAEVVKLQGKKSSLL